MTQQRFAFEPVSILKSPPSTLRNSRSTLNDPPSTLRNSSSTVDDPGQSDPPGAMIRSALFVRNPRARRYVVRVSAAGVLRVTIPRRGSKRQAIEFVERQQAWITNQLERAERERAQPHEVMPAEVLAALRLRAKRELPARLLELAGQFDLTVSRVTIRNQRFRWGSCSRAGAVSLNWRLVTMPDWVRDYVLIHELMHLRRMDHSPVFWAHVAAAYPNYQEARAWLRTFRTVPPPV